MANQPRQLSKEEQIDARRNELVARGKGMVAAPESRKRDGREEVNMLLAIDRVTARVREMERKIDELRDLNPITVNQMFRHQEDVVTIGGQKTDNYPFKVTATWDGDWDNDVNISVTNGIFTLAGKSTLISGGSSAVLPDINHPYFVVAAHIDDRPWPKAEGRIVFYAVASGWPLGDPGRDHDNLTAGFIPNGEVVWDDRLDVGNLREVVLALIKCDPTLPKNVEVYQVWRGGNIKNTILWPNAEFSSTAKTIKLLDTDDDHDDGNAGYLGLYNEDSLTWCPVDTFSIPCMVKSGSDVVTRELQWGMFDTNFETGAAVGEEFDRQSLELMSEQDGEGRDAYVYQLFQFDDPDTAPDPADDTTLFLVRNEEDGCVRLRYLTVQQLISFVVNNGGAGGDGGGGGGGGWGYCPFYCNQYWWKLGGDHTECFGNSIGDSSRALAIDLDSHELYGSWDCINGDFGCDGNVYVDGLIKAGGTIETTDGFIADGRPGLDMEDIYFWNGTEHIGPYDLVKGIVVAAD